MRPFLKSAQNAILLLGCSGYLICCNTGSQTSSQGDADAADTTVATAALVERGGYLVALGGCGDCHSPKVMTPRGPAEDSTRLLSGYDSSRPFTGYDKEVARGGQLVIFNVESTAFAGPWGVSYAANLTPDHTGIGSWSFAQFRKAMKEGKWRGMDHTRPLSPPMPWQNYKRVTDEDMAAIFAYLRSLEPIHNPVPVPVHPDRM